MVSYQLYIIRSRILDIPKYSPLQPISRIVTFVDVDLVITEYKTAWPHRLPLNWCHPVVPSRVVSFSYLASIRDFPCKIKDVRPGLTSLLLAQICDPHRDLVNFSGAETSQLRSNSIVYTETVLIYSDARWFQLAIS